MTHEAMKAREKDRRADWKKDEKKWAKEIEAWEAERTKWSNMIKLACEDPKNPKEKLSDEELQEIKDLVDQIRQNLLELQKQINCLNLPQVKAIVKKETKPKSKKSDQTEVIADESTDASQIDPPPGFEAKVSDFPKLGSSGATATDAPVLAPAPEAQHVQIPIQIENQQVPAQVIQPVAIPQIWPIPQLAPLQRLATVDPNILLWLDDQGRILLQTIQGMVVIRQIPL